MKTIISLLPPYVCHPGHIAIEECAEDMPCIHSFPSGILLHTFLLNLDMTAAACAIWPKHVISPSSDALLGCDCGV